MQEALARLIPLFLILYDDVFLFQLMSSTSLIAEQAGCNAAEQEVAIHNAPRMPQLTVPQIPDEWVVDVRSL